MTKQKQYVFSARTTEEGLRRLNELKAERGIGWDDLVINAMCAHYGLDSLVMALPKREKPAKEALTAEQQAPMETTSEDYPTEEKPKKKSK